MRSERAFRWGDGTDFQHGRRSHRLIGWPAHRL